MPGPALVDQPEILWQVDLDAGSAASPLVHDGEVIIAPRDGRIRALDADTGHEICVAPARRRHRLDADDR